MKTNDYDMIASEILDTEEAYYNRKWDQSVCEAERAHFRAEMAKAKAVRRTLDTEGRAAVDELIEDYLNDPFIGCSSDEDIMRVINKPDGPY